MQAWIENFKSALEKKSAVIVHGNVRDGEYVYGSHILSRGFSNLASRVAADLGFDRVYHWGVTNSANGTRRYGLWALERIEDLKTLKTTENEISAADPELTLLSRWLARESMREGKNLFIIHYADLLIPYSGSSGYSDDQKRLLLTLEKLIKNLSETNKLLLVTLSDASIPPEVYVNSPRVGFLKVPKPSLEERVTYLSYQLEADPELVRLAAQLTEDFYAVDLGQLARRLGSLEKLTKESLKETISQYKLGVKEDPWKSLSFSEGDKGLLSGASSWFMKRVVGQNHAIKKVLSSILRARVGLSSLSSERQDRPKCIFFFAGPTGVGKTFLAKKIAEFIFGREDAFIRFDMSEFKEAHSVAKLIGSPPGYVGYDEGGLLTNAVDEKPFTVLLFDEIEKAHPKIMDIFLQILDDGRLTDSKGKTVFFSECVIVFTSNIGARTTDSAGNPIKEKESLNVIESIKDTKERTVQRRKHFIKSVQNFFTSEISRPELLGRLSQQIIPFDSLENESIQKKLILTKLEEIEEVFKAKFSGRGYSLAFDESAVDYFVEKHGKTMAALGGRGLMNALDEELGSLLAEIIAYEEASGGFGARFLVLSKTGELLCKREI